MSYAFNVRAATKAAAKEAIAATLAEVVQTQPGHALEQVQVLSAASAFVDLLPDDEAKDVSVSVTGAVGWTGTFGVDHVFTTVGVGVSASLITREAVAA